jgi:photosystem II stability/assembly factor-like uncharacterized protein
MKFTFLFIALLLSFSCYNQSPNSSDNPPSWKQVAILPDSAVYNDIFFIDSKEGWLVGEYGLIYHSQNSGRSWEPQNSCDYNSPLNTIHFIDHQYGWATGLRSALYTIDGGGKWNYVDLVLYGAITLPFTVRIFFIDRENLLLFWSTSYHKSLSISHLMFYADSAKFSWLTLEQFPFLPSSVTHIANKIWFADVEQNMHISTDGGETWSSQQVETDSCSDISAINDIFFEDEKNGWFCSNSTVYYSIDGGDNWQCKASLPDISLKRIYFFNDEGWVMGEKIIYYSSNGVYSWEEQFHVDGEEKLVSMSFVNNSNGWVLTENGNVYRYGIE